MKKVPLVLLVSDVCLLMLVCVIIVRSYFVADFWQYRLNFDAGYYGPKKLVLTRGWFWYAQFPAQTTSKPDEIVPIQGGSPHKAISRGWIYLAHDPFPIDQGPLTLSFSRLSVPGFQLLRVTRGTSIKFALWYLLAALLIYPAFFVLMKWKKGRVGSEHRCAHCTYNLTGNASGICPECGTTIGPAPGAAAR